MPGFDTEIRHVGEGWQPIVRELHQKVLAIDPEVNVLQIKEKFGGLRYYYGSDHFDLIEPLVREAEEKCAVTCEECGEPGVTNSVRGWWRTECEQHRQARIERVSRGL